MRCPREVTPHLTPIINVALQYIKYDPNYSYGDDDDGDEDVDMDGEEFEDVSVVDTSALLFVLHPRMKDLIGLPPPIPCMISRS